MRYRLRRLVALLGLMYSCAASAYLLKPRFEPATPVAMQPVSMILDAGGCTYLYDSPDYADVVIQGSRIEVIIDAAHPPVEGTGCTDPIKTYPFALGGFAAGQYEVHVTLRDDYYSALALYRSMQVAPLTVVAPKTRATIPAATPAALAMLAFLLLIASRQRGVVMVALSLVFLSHDARADAAAVFGGLLPSRPSRCFARNVCDIESPTVSASVSSAGGRHAISDRTDRVVVGVVVLVRGERRDQRANVLSIHAAGWAGRDDGLANGLLHFPHRCIG